MRTPLETSFLVAFEEAKLRLDAAFAEECRKAVADAAGSSGLFIAFQNRAQDLSGELADRMLELVANPSSDHDLNSADAQAQALEVFDQFTQFVVQHYEAENARLSQARKVNAPLIHSSLFRSARQRLSAGIPERIARPPFFRRFLKRMARLREKE